jgi:phospholipase/carboxylesterase
MRAGGPWPSSESVHTMAAPVRRHGRPRRREKALAGDELEDLKAVLPPLLQSLEALGFVARYLNPPDFDTLMEAIGAPDEALRAALPRLEAWAENLTGLRTALEAASAAALAAFEALRAPRDQPEGLMAVFRALRHLPRAQEALYPLAAGLPPVNRFFHDPISGRDTERERRTLGHEPRENTGLFHAGGGPGERSGFSMYVPEYYTPDRAWPLVMALHGGSGNGRGFLWSWLRAARSQGTILIAPTATGDTWALHNEDADTPNLARILAGVQANWTIDPQRMLLTGLSDGGTFSYLIGMRKGSPFTHLAPVAAAFHPMMVEFADAERLAGLPVYIVHGALDWMFPVATARHAREALTAAGARVVYREIEDLAHAYPREENPAILDWLGVA